MPSQMHRLNTDALHCHEGHQDLEISEPWRQQPHRQLKRAVPPSFAPEDYPPSRHEGLYHWLQGLGKDAGILQLGRKTHSLDANLLSVILIDATMLEIVPGIHKHQGARSRHIEGVQLPHGSRPFCGTFRSGNEYFGAIREPGDARSVRRPIMVIHHHEVEPVLACLRNWHEA